MLPTRHYRLEDENEIRRLIAHHPWATFVSPTSRGLVASHYPVILDPTAEESSTGNDTGISLVSHFGRPDDTLHELGQHEVLVIVQGPHDYVSPSWYAPGDLVPTWNHVTAHLWGTPELLDHDENYTMLCRLTDRFEHGRHGGRNLLDDEPATRRAARGTRGLRMRVTRFEAKAKLSQNKAPEVVHNIIDQLEPDNPQLAAEMRNRHLGPSARPQLGDHDD